MRTSTTLAVLGVWLCGWSTVAFAAPSLASAERAARELRWNDARSEVDALVRAGGLDRPSLLAAFELRAEVAAVLDDAAAAEKEYRKLLSLDPTRSSPRRSSPVFTEPFTRAQKAVSETGGLRLQHRPPARVLAGTATPLDVQLLDPLGLAAAVVATGRAGDQPFTANPPRVPPLAAGVEAQYQIEAVDASGNVLAFAPGGPFYLRAEALPSPSVAAAPAPAIVVAQPPPPRPRLRLWKPAIGVGAAALGILGGAIGLDAAASAQYDHLQSTCAPRCTSAQLGTLHAEEAGAIALYTVGGVAAAAAIVLFIVDRVRH